MVNFCKSSKCLAGKTAIITGANTGVGYETALEFAKRGCHVIMACRNLEKAAAAREKIVAATGNETVVVKQLVLDSLESVRTFARDILETEDRLDLLVNNGGVMNSPNGTTADGLQVEMATNYFSHFLLTNLLLDLLKKSTPSRIINVSSSVAGFVRNLKLDELNKYDGAPWTYHKSKLCNVYFTQKLAEKLEGTGVTTYSLHPGAVRTELQRHSPLISFMRSFFLTPEEGAQTQIYLSLEDGIEELNGEHFINCKHVKPYCSARDEEKRQSLWEISEKLVGLKA